MIFYGVVDEFDEAAGRPGVLGRGGEFVVVGRGYVYAYAAGGDAGYAPY